MAHIYDHRTFPSPVTWHDAYDGDVGNSPVVGGKDVNGEPIYVGRARHAGDTIPGKIVPSHRVCYVAHGGDEHRHNSYQVLTNPMNSKLVWVPANGNVPHGAIQGGAQGDGTKLYIGRAWHEGSMVVGKVHPNHHVLYVSFDGNEIPIHGYEVLVLSSVNTDYY